MDAQLPTLDPGVTYLDDGDAPPALYRLVGHHLADADGPAYWVDARNAASPDAIRRYAPVPLGDRLHVARAFTGFLHYELVRALPGRVSPGTALVVAPNVASLYADDDVAEAEGDAMFAATLELLSALADAVAAPVVVTASEDCDQVRAAADRTLDADRTRAGLRVEGSSFDTTVYWDDWGFQTTIPYWADLLGVVDDGDDATAVDPVAPGV